MKERPHLLTTEVRDALSGVEGHCEPGGLELPRARRFPVRIVLSDLATALSKEPDISLLEYVATLIRKRTGRAVSTDDLRAWLGAYPWLLVLDGLDEVPASTNRDEVLRKVEELWIDAAQCQADLLVLHRGDTVLGALREDRDRSARDRGIPGAEARRAPWKDH